MCHTFNDLFLRQLRKLHDIELKHLSLLPHLFRASETEELRDFFQAHLEETRNQITRLDEVFGLIGADSTRLSCSTMEWLVRECEELLEEEKDPSALRDAAVIASSQCIEHHEIAEYGVCRTYAQELGLSRAAALLQTSLGEEIAADERLTLLAEGSLFHTGINARAHEASVA